MSGRLSWLDAKTMWLCLVDYIAAGCRSLAVSLGEGGRMVTLVLSTSGLVDEECRSDCRRS